VHELGFVLADADIAVLVTSRGDGEIDYLARLVETFPELGALVAGDPVHVPAAPALRHILLAGPRPECLTLPDDVLDRLVAAVPPEEVDRRRRAVRVRDPFLMMYTSGTTSRPKGCLLTHEAVVRTVDSVALRYALTAEDRFWSPLPPFHMGTVNPLGAVFLTGGTFLCSPRFDAGLALEMLEREAATLAFLSFPALVNDLVNHPDITGRDLSRLRAIQSNAAVQSPAVRAQLREHFPHVVQTGMYGMTETAGAACCTAVYDPEGSGWHSVGRPMPGVSIRIRRSDGSEADVDEIGEIQISGFGMFEGYHRRPEDTARTIRGGWIHSGDRASMNARGEVMFHGRMKDMLKVGGENVATAEIEDFLAGHPAVLVCQVVGVPHPRLAEVPAAFVECRPGTTVTEQEIVEFCTGRIAGFKIPRHVRVVHDWPRTASGKYQKNVLAERLVSELDTTRPIVSA
jgi:fatty-acyl-CoA synthase/long-chain acyl-CoA synthetase